MPPSAASTAETAYKTAKQAFVANNRGSTVLDIQAVSLVGWTSYILYATLIPPPPTDEHPSPALEYLTVFFPLLLGQTVCSDHPYLYNGCILLLASLSRVYRIRSRQGRGAGLFKPKDTVDNNDKDNNVRKARTAVTTHHKPFLTTWRAHMMCMTMIAILAVDFPLFPRRFGKTEDWGTSLMDVGVGSFVFSQGLVSASTILKAQKAAPPVTASGSGGIGGGGGGVAEASQQTLLWINSLVGTVKKCLPVIVLGFVRVVMVKGVDYPEHVTEYGVHWNFFFTLAAMPILSILLVPVRRYIPTILLITLILAGQTLALHAGGLEKWVIAPESGSRRGTGLMNMNKEGIISLPGYLGIHLIGALVGEFVLRTPSSSVDRKTIEDYHPMTRGLALFSAVSWACLYVLKQVLGLAVSRRMANAPYVAWTVAYNTTFLLGYHSIEQYVFLHGVDQRRRLPRLLEAVNKNGLVVFLLANLLTGIINISMQTMYASDLVAFCVLLAYTSALSVAAWLLRGRRLML